MRLFYQNLYSSEYHSSATAREAFLDKLELPSLNDEQKRQINRPITEDEVLEAIKTLNGGKAPGPDGFGPEFYKTFSKIVVKPLTDMYLHSFENQTLPQSLNLANISLILKKSKPPEECGSYRPISLIGVDSKILSKVMARRLEGLLPTLVNPDQTGFIENRLSSFNVRRLLNVIQYINQHGDKALTVSLDAEKAFDRVEWCYLFDVLKRFGLGGNFLWRIQTI